MSRRLRRAFLWGAGLLVVGALAVLVAVPFAIRSVVTPAFVAARASSALGREVSVGAVGLHFTPLLRIRLERVAIAPDVVLGAIDVGLRVVSLLERKIEVDLVEVEDASFTLVRRADGGIVLHGAIPAEDASKQAGVEDAEPVGPPALPRLPRIELRRVNVAFVDHAIADPPLQVSLPGASARAGPRRHRRAPEPFRRGGDRREREGRSSHARRGARPTRGGGIDR